jgi:hypothetical protein
MNQKRRGPWRAPLQTETWSNSYRDGFVCQAEVLAVGEKQQSLGDPLTLPSWTNKTRNSRTPTTGKAVPEPVLTSFKSHGFSYRQIAREGDIAIYEQRWRNSENVAYEVVRLRVRTHPFKNNGRPYEAYPRSEEWGLYGFTLTDKDAAFNKLKQLLAGFNQSGPGRRQTGTGTNTTQTPN